MPVLVPVDRRFVHVIPGELVDDDERCERCELVEGGAERVDVVQHPPCGRSVEAVRIIELLERDTAIVRTCRSIGIDREHVVARSRELRGDPSLRAAADLENARGRRRKVGEDEVGEVHARAPGSHM